MDPTAKLNEWEKQLAELNGIWRSLARYLGGSGLWNHIRLESGLASPPIGTSAKSKREKAGRSQNYRARKITLES